MEIEEEGKLPESEAREEEIEAGSATENENQPKKKRTKKEIRNLIIVGSIYGVLAVLTATVLIIGYSGSSSSTVPSTHLTTTAAGYYDEDKNLVSSFSTEDVELTSQSGYYSLFSIKAKEGAPYLVLPTSYDGTRIMYTSDLEEGINIFGNSLLSDSIKEIYFPNLYWTIGANSFSGMDSLSYVSLAGASEGRLTISSGAFKNCPLLKEVELPKNLVSLGEGAFAGTALETVYFKGTISSFESITNREKAFEGTVTIKCTDGETTVTSSPSA